MYLRWLLQHYKLSSTTMAQLNYIYLDNLYLITLLLIDWPLHLSKPTSLHLFLLGKSVFPLPPAFSSIPWHYVNKYNSFWIPHVDTNLPLFQNISKSRHLFHASNVNSQTDYSSTCKRWSICLVTHLWDMQLPNESSTDGLCPTICLKTQFRFLDVLSVCANEIIHLRWIYSKLISIV